jgi:iron(III) transport system substrate-binding protein
MNANENELQTPIRFQTRNFMVMTRRFATAALIAASLLPMTGAGASAEEINIYSSRHYDTDLEIYEAFTDATGIEVNLIEDDAGALIERIKAEGANSPADVLITVDAANLAAASSAGLFQAVDSDVLNERVPESLRHPDGEWYAMTKRARVIMYRKADVDVTGLERYEDLADPRFAGMICISRRCTRVRLAAIGCRFKVQSSAESPPPATTRCRPRNCSRLRTA